MMGKVICCSLLVIGLAGCAHDNGIVIKGSSKSTQAENIEAAGKVAAGAWDRLFGNKK